MATVNGGVWETSNVNPLSGNVSWTTTTDQLPSLAISAVAINPANINHIYAGTGNLSSDFFEGGQAVGLYRSVNGGTTWTQLGFDTFHGMVIQNIVPLTLNTIFVAARNLGSSNGGIFRSDDFGNTWRKLSGASGTGLPNAPVSDLVSFSVNTSTIGFYTAVPGSHGGIFRSVDNGQTWQSVTNNLATTVAIASNIKLSVSPVSPKPVYAGIIGSDGNLMNVFRSFQGTDGLDNNRNHLTDEPAEASWQAISQTPPDIGGNLFLFHFAILADNTHNNLVYVSGSGQDEPGAQPGLMFLGNSSSRVWTMLTGTGTTTPRRTSTRTTWSFPASISCADDGGIYRLVNPLGLSRQAPTVWQSAIGNLRNSEITSVALDNRGSDSDTTTDDVFLAGIFDNGSAVRDPTTGQWTQVAGGDGQVAQAFDNGIIPGAEYVTSQNIGLFKKRSGFNNEFNDLGRNVNGVLPGTKLDLNFDPGLGFFVPYSVHATDPNRILLGSFENLYESTDGGFSFTSLGGVDSFLILNPFGPPEVHWFPTPLPEFSGAGGVDSIAYGSSVNAEIAYVGTTSGDIFVRTTAGGTFQRTNFSAAAAATEGAGPHGPLDLVLDTNNPQRAYAVTDSGVYMTQNMLDWQSITDDLSGLALPGSKLNLRSIALVNDDTASISDDVILVGGLGGVFRRKVAAPAGPKWSEYGQGLPNVLVSDMEYDARSDTLVAGTFGRGVWSISNVKSTIGLESRLQINGTSAADTILMFRDPDNPSLLDVFFNNTTSKPSITVQLSVVQSIQVSGGNGADRLEIQSSGGIVSIANGIDFLGGNDKSIDTLVLNNSSDTQDTVGVIFSSGSVKGSLVGPLTFSGVESITIQCGSGNDSINASATSVPVTLVGGRGADVLRGGSGNDILVGRDGIFFNDKLYGGPGNDTALLDFGDFFDGGTDKDGIDFYGTAGNDHIVVSRQVGPDGAEAVIELNKQTQVFNYVNGETINVYAGAGNDHVVMDESAGSHWQAQFFGEQGNDHLYGGAMDDLLDGGPGNDFLDGGGGDNTLIGGGGHDVLRNGQAPLVSLSIAAASTAAPVAAETSTKSSLARLFRAPAQLDNRSRLLELSRIGSSRALLGGYSQNPMSMDFASSHAILFESQGVTKKLEDELLHALTSESLQDDNWITGTMNAAFAAYDRPTPRV